MSRALTVLGLLLLAGGSTCAPPPPASRDAAVDSAGCGDGFALPAGQGACFFVDEFGLSAPGTGVDLTGDGAPDARFNEAFERERDYFNTLFRNAIEAGQYLSMVEIAGLCAPFGGADDAVTVKFYPCLDADDDVSNNACREPGCGAMRADPDYIVDGQPLNRTAPVSVQGGRVQGELVGTLYLKIDENALPIRRTTFDLLLRDDLSELSDSVMCGAATARGLDFISMCKLFPDPCPPFIPANLTLAVTLRDRGYQPDVDLDGDGLETFEIDPASYEVARCRDGDGTITEGSACLQDARMADGYSMCFDLHGIPGSLSL